MRNVPTIRCCGTGEIVPSRFVGHRISPAIMSTDLLEVEEYRMQARGFASSLELEGYQKANDVDGRS